MFFVFIMLLITKNIAGKSGKYFVGMQNMLGTVPERLVDPDAVPTRWFVRYSGGCVSAFSEDCISENGFCAAITPPMDRASLMAKLAGLEIESVFRVLD